MGKTGRARAVKLFDRKRMAADFIKLSKQIIKAHIE
jgi:hypothetical protein